MTDIDAVVVGAGPNGLVAAITLAQAGWKVVVLESGDTAGGGCRSAELTLPGFTHDICSAIHPLGVASPALRELDLEQHGVRWIHPAAPLAQPLDGGRAAVMERSIDATAVGLGSDGPAWRSLFGPFVRNGAAVVDSVLAPLDIPPRHPIVLGRFGLSALRSAIGITKRRFNGDEAPALFGGIAAHAMMPLTAPVTAGAGLMLGTLAHHVGWPMAEGGSQRITDSLVSILEGLGGEVRCGQRVKSLDELPSARAVLCDVSPKVLIDIAADRLPPRYRDRLEKYRYGPGVFKIDWALDAPIPWTNPELARAGTIHIGGTIEELDGAETELAAGRIAERPYVLLAQPSLFDPTRAPTDKHTVWAYCHVPAGCEADQTAAMEAQIERFAPGFRERILARHTMDPAAMQAHNANYVGGDIGMGATDLKQFLFRPVPSLHPWSTPVDGLYLCSASTPPGVGVHGMCGRAAARLALRRHG